MRLGIDRVSTVGSRFYIIARGYDGGMWKRPITDSVAFVVVGVRLAVLRVDEKGRVVVVNCRRLLWGRLSARLPLQHLRKFGEWQDCSQ